MKVVVQCLYCGKKWESHYNSSQNERCSKCGDTNLTYKEVSKKVNYYLGDPPFPEDNGLDVDHFFGSEFRGD